MTTPATFRVVKGERAEVIEPAEIRPPEYTDETLALRFADRHADNARYIAKWSKWLTFDGRRWRVDDTLLAFDQAREICREASQEAVRREQTRIASAVASVKTVAAVERMAKADRRLAATVDQFDSKPFRLNTPSGTIDLTTSETHPHDPKDYITQMTAVAPDDGCGCPTWFAFLNRVTGNDVELVAYLRRMCGYLLTGDTSAHALFFLFGHGSNGKSVFINTIAGILGDYHRAAAVETFTATSVDAHPTGLAALHGARVVTAVETEEGRQWAESRIKALTGGDRIAARFMRGDFFEFTPAFKLMIAGNHKPGLRSVDEAIRRRFNLIPFTVTISPEERDEKLTERLKAEWPGILAWMIDGFTAWAEAGLSPPEAVKSATAVYLESEDSLSAWIDEECVRDVNAWAASSALFGSWTVWAGKAGEKVGTQRRFAQALEAHGFKRSRKNHGRGFDGIALKPNRYGGLTE